MNPVNIIAIVGIFVMLAFAAKIIFSNPEGSN